MKSFIHNRAISAPVSCKPHSKRTAGKILAEVRNKKKTELKESTKIYDLRFELSVMYHEVTDRAFASNLITGNKEAEYYVELLNTRIKDYKEKMAKRGKRV